MSSERFGGFITTFTGRLFYPLDPRPEDVDLRDMIQGLSLKCRWSGQCREFYSIAAHSVRVAQVARFLAEKDRKDVDYCALVYTMGMVHDGNEAYLPDVPGPIKKFIDGWYDIEHKVQAAIHQRLGLPVSHPEIERYVKQADLMLLSIEQQALFERKSTPEELFNNYDHRPLWKGYPEIPSAVEALAGAFPYHDPRETMFEHLVPMVSEE